MKIIKPQAGFQEKFLRSRVDFAIGGGSSGGGKMQPVDSRILTPNGWVKMGNIKTGDIISDVFGNAQRVTETYEHGLKDVYLIETEIGTCEAGLDHLWEFNIKHQWVIGTTRNLMTLLQFGVYLPVFEQYRSELNKIISITLLPEQKECRCIEVSGKEKLYVTNNFIVTHNTFVSCLLPAYFYKDPQFRAVYVRRNLGELTAGGGLVDTILDIYPKHLFSRMAESGSPVFQFNSGAELTLTHFADESPAKFNERVKGWQYPLIYLDELTAYEWNTITTIMTRNRGSSSGIKPMIRATCNPKRNSWVRKWLDWYIGEDGFIIPERDGVVRYFYMTGKGVDEVVWGMSKAEVYEKCKADIDRKLFLVGKSKYITPDSLIKSFVFYRGKISENEAVLKNNPNYLGSLAASSGAQAQQYIEGNWNVDEDDDISAEVTTEEARSLFYNDPNKTGVKMITADIALTGKDNMVVLAWDGFHIIDSLIIQTTSAPNAILQIKHFALRHDIPDRNIIFDAAAIGTFIGGEAGFIRGAIPFMGGKPPVGNPNYSNIKSQCADKVIAMIKTGLISCSESVAQQQYFHQTVKTFMTFADRLVQEMRILRFDPRSDGMSSDKKRLITKKRMVEILGSSPDIIDNLILRMAMALEYQGNDTPQYHREGEIEYEDGDDIFNYL